MTTTIPQSLGNLNTSPAAVAAAAMAAAMLVEFSKPNQRRRALRVIEEARDRLVAQANVHRIRDADPHGQALARLEAAAALERVLDLYLRRAA